MATDPRDENLSALSLLDEPVRRRLYDWVVARSEPVGRDEAARSLGITRSLAAFHLDRLAEAGLLESGYRRLTGRSGPGAGRPARIYWRADREFAVSLPERRYERAGQLFASALEKIAGEAPPVELRKAAQELGHQLGGSADRRGKAADLRDSAADRPGKAADRLIAALADGGYEPFLDASGDIRLRNCPFHALAERHRPLVCGTNLALAGGLVEGAQASDFRPVLDARPGDCCVAFVRNRE